MHSMALQLRRAVSLRDEAYFSKYLSQKRGAQEIHDLIMEIGIEGLSPRDEKGTDYYFVMSQLCKANVGLGKLIWQI